MRASTTSARVSTGNEDGCVCGYSHFASLLQSPSCTQLTFPIAPTVRLGVTAQQRSRKQTGVESATPRTSHAKIRASFFVDAQRTLTRRLPGSREPACRPIFQVPAQLRAESQQTHGGRTSAKCKKNDVKKCNSRSLLHALVVKQATRNHRPQLWWYTKHSTDLERASLVQCVAWCHYVEWPSILAGVGVVERVQELLDLRVGEFHRFAPFLVSRNL